MANETLDSDPVFGPPSSTSGLERVQISRLREHARGRIAFWIIGSLITIVVLSYAVFTLLIFRNPGVSFAELKDLTRNSGSPGHRHRRRRHRLLFRREAGGKGHRRRALTPIAIHGGFVACIVRSKLKYRISLPVAVNFL